MPLLPVISPSVVWKFGIANSCEIPPPPAPDAYLALSFHTDSVGAGPKALSVVPPTPVTSGWDAGSLTPRLKSWRASLLLLSSVSHTRSRVGSLTS